LIRRLRLRLRQLLLLLPLLLLLLHQALEVVLQFGLLSLQNGDADVGQFQLRPQHPYRVLHQESTMLILVVLLILFVILVVTFIFVFIVIIIIIETDNGVVDGRQGGRVL
jgi:ABC-type sugar transport system permease subunit